MRQLARTLAAPLALLLPLSLSLTPGLPATAQDRRPVETAPPNAPHQEPAFENQTRAPRPAEPAEVRVETLAEDLPRLWAIAFLPDGRLLATAKAGALHLLDPQGGLSEPIAGVPEVASAGQGGLLDVALAPDFADSGLVYLSYAEPRDEGGNGTSVARARLVLQDGGGSAALEGLEVIFRQTPSYDGSKHFGSRLVFAPDGRLFVTLGERSDRPIRDQAQDLGSGLGKVFRLEPDGSVPADNPFAGQSGGRSGAQPGIWSYGHRNIQSAALDAEGRLWTVEHGPKGGDELNRPQAGRNYGWPVITYGVAYSGQPVGEGITQRDGMEQPVYYWDPVIAPSGMALYEAEAIPEWQGAFLVGGLVSQGLVVLHLEQGRVVSEDRVPLGARIRDLAVGPEGAVYALTESRGGSSALLRILPQDG